MEFYPGVVIFADEAARAIYEQLITSSLLHYVEQSFRSGIGWILPADLDRTSYQYQLLSDSSAFSADTCIAAIRAMRDKVSITEAREKGYSIVKTVPHWYIVGHLHSQDTRTVVDEMRGLGIDLDDISCMFVCDPRENESSNQQDGNLTHNRSSSKGMIELANWAKRQRINFCYLYGDIKQRHHLPHYKPALYYAAAEALFFLLHAQGEVQKQAQIPSSKTQNVFSYGTLSTSMIYSPRTVIQAACAAQVTRLLLAEWLESILMTAKISKNTLTYDVKFYTDGLKKWIFFEEATRKLLQPPSASPHKLPRSKRMNAQELTEPHEFAPSIRLLIRYLFPAQTSNNELDPSSSSQSLLQQYQQFQENFSKRTTQLFQNFLLDRGIAAAEWSNHIRQRILPATASQPSPLPDSEDGDEIKPAWSSEIEKDHLQWLQSLSVIWDFLQQQACENLMIHIQRMCFQHGPDWTIAYCDLLSDTIEDISQEVEKRGEDSLINIYKIEQREDAQRLTLDDMLEPIEQALEVANTHAQSMPTGHTRQATNVLAAGILSAVLWILVSIFIGEQIWLLPLLLCSCLLGIYLAHRAYTNRLFLSSHKQNQSTILNSLHSRKLAECKKLSFTKRREMLEALKQRIQVMTSDHLKKLEIDFKQQSMKAVEELFQSESGKRDFLGGNKLYFKTKDEAMAALLPPDNTSLFPISDNSSSGRIFISLTRNKLDNLLRDRKLRLLDAFNANTPASYTQKLVEAVRQRLTEFLSSDDIMFKFGGQEDLWERMQSHLNAHLLWQPQQPLSQSPIVFVLAKSSDMVKAAESLRSIYSSNAPIVEIPMPDSKGSGNNAGYSTDWLMVTALYYQNGFASEDRDQTGKLT